ncbi:DUF4390 domain-containing protein [Rhodoferax sp. U11-2br]|uniref:DUF4390 domain-containing protein n=1 Tax=Rhodoferax sp. U11-2br TaxID=2838878 RepID=UPI0020368A37|nr:DUF4390 domain-containing protein [Rhodoferax sp. U11-2br]
MMASITRYSTNKRPSGWAGLLAAVLLCWLQAWTPAAAANASAAESGSRPTLTLERSDSSLLLSVQLKFELPVVVEDALYKGIPIYFVAQSELLRERWYWTSKTIATAQRRMRLAYHPLTRRWRLTIGAADMNETTQGLTLGQSFESLDDAMAVVRRISRWKIAEVQDLPPGNKYLVDFSFELDTSQLPRPLQIGTLGQSDWMIELRQSQPLDLERVK